MSTTRTPEAFVATWRGNTSTERKIYQQDYTGPEVEGTIKNLLLNLVRAADRPEVSSGFIQITNVKGTRADRLARQVFTREIAPTQVVTWIEVESIIRRQ